MIEYHYKGSARFGFAAMLLLYGGVAALIVLAPFLLGAKQYSQRSPVAENDYEQATVGADVGVAYLPNDPNVRRVARSLGREKAESRIQAAHMMLIVGCVFPLLMGFAGLMSMPTYRASSGQRPFK